MRSNPPRTAARPVRGRPAPRVPYDVTMPVALAVHLLVVGAVVGSMVRFDATDRLQVLLPLGIAGLMVGYALALTRLPDVTSHVVTVWLGTVSSLTAVSLSVFSPEQIVASRGRVVWSLARSVVTSVVGSDGSRLGDPQLLALLGMTTWMLAYTSSWVLYRRGWLAAALAPAAVVIAVSMRYEQERPSWPVAMFLFAAVMLFARNQILERQRRWAHRGLRSPDLVGLRALALALPVAVLVLAAGHELPLAAPQEAVEPVAGAMSRSWNALRDEFVDRLGLQGEGTGNYAEFPETFDVGGRLELGEAIVATLASDAPHYLALRRYDFYDGEGWSSHVDETFRLEEDGATTKVTNVIFARSQSVALSGAVTEEREQVAGVVTVVQPKDDLVFTIETFSGSSEAVVTVLGWERIAPREIDVADVDVSTLPVDLQGLLRDLQDAAISPDPNGGEPRFVDRTVRDRIALERDRLDDYPVKTDITLDADGRLMVGISGRVPNYDDIEAVFVPEDRMVAGDQYRVLGLRSLADDEVLASASTEYPGWITSRYLELPDAVTERTRALAGTVAVDAGARTPFDEAWAVQEYLRANFRYDINPPVPEDGADVVDYFLFESLVGRCEQYASAMVVMMRSLGVPARLVSGYRASDEVNDVGQYVFREEQAHTWVEVFFPGYGWIPFEPTAGQDGFDYTGSDGPSPSAEAEQELDAATPTPPSTVDVTPTPTAEASPTPAASPALVKKDGGGGASWPLLCGLAALVPAAAAGWLVMRRRSARGLTPVAALYLGLLRLGSRVGVRTPPSATPAEYGAALTRALPRAGQSISTIVDAYHWDQFGPPGERSARLARAREAWRSIRRPGWRGRVGGR